MHPTYAYAHGALVKMAEHRVNPYSFVQAAVRTQDPVAIKIANALIAYEKTAGGGKAVKDVFDSAIDAIPTNTPGPFSLPGRGRGLENQSDSLLDILGQAPDALRGGMAGRRNAQAIIGDEASLAPSVAAAQRLIRGQNYGLGAGGIGLGALGAGGAGVYGGMDADTYGNQAANLANDYLGTDFGTTSRLGNMIG